MPWFETRETNGNGQWGIHWTMANRNPDIVDGSGKRQIAAHYYPEIGPYASGRDDVVDYQLLLMKYAGVDGVFIDWPGTLQHNDYPANHRNSEAIIRGTERVGLEFAVVYEDRNIGIGWQDGVVSDRIAAAQNDMRYAGNNFFTKSNYVRVNGAPLLLVFGPITFENPNDWSQIFNVLNQRPTFLTLWYESQDAGQNAAGEYCWIWTDYIDGIRNFYQNRPLGVKIGGAYPGFHTFYREGGWQDDIHWQLPFGSTFSQLLDLALQYNIGMIQLNTWNDYGEGTMIEPTREFGDSFLRTLQEKAGVPFSGRELGLVKDLYFKRQEHKESRTKMDQLQVAFEALAALEVDIAEEILNSV